jgi:hypothetical protein
MKKTIIVFGALAVLAAFGLAAKATDNVTKAKPSSSTEPSGIKYSVPAASSGIAAKYPGDKGIEQDKSVIFHEDFEQGTISDLASRWTEISNKDRRILDFVTDSVPGSTGTRSLRMTATKGHDTGGHLWKLLDPGYDQLYARFYVKFAKDAPYVHHFVHMGGQMNSPPYPLGGAGSRPSGNASFSTGIDLANREQAAPPGAWLLYTYWCEMRSYETPEGKGTIYYGNAFEPTKLQQAPRDRWQCVEFMIKTNSAPDKSDGEEVFWINGRLIARFAPGTPSGTWLRDKFHVTGTFNTNPQPFEGFRWRTTNALKINWFWLLYYLASVFENDIKPADPTIPYNSQKGEVLFDDIVLSTEYIGPITTVPPDSGQTGCDFNGDGRVNVVDVIQLLRLHFNNPQDTRADYDGDGESTVRDALALLFDIIAGKC